jgi:hypothetical protein
MAGFQPRAINLDVERADSAAQPFSVHGHFEPPARHADLPLLGPERAPPPSGSGGFAIGPFHADTVTKFSARSGKAHLAPHDRLDGVSVLGGAVGASVDGRGGMVTLQWKTTP